VRKQDYSAEAHIAAFCYVPVIPNVPSLVLKACLAAFLIRHSTRACFISVCLILRPLGSISASEHSQCHSIWSAQLFYWQI